MNKKQGPGLARIVSGRASDRNNDYEHDFAAILLHPSTEILRIESRPFSGGGMEVTVDFRASGEIDLTSDAYDDAPSLTGRQRRLLAACACADCLISHTETPFHVSEYPFSHTGMVFWVPDTVSLFTDRSGTDIVRAREIEARLAYEE
jgi:hypothetical protein